MFGFNPSTFSDPFDVNAVAGANNRERAKLKSQSFLTDSQLGGAATSIQARNKAEDIMAKANASAQRSAQGAQTFGNIANFAGSMGTIGASKGGFSGFFDQWKGWGNAGSSGDSFAGVPNSILDSVLKQP
jgi:hypothetical protein